MSILKHIIKRNNIILQKGENLHIGLTLVWNQVLAVRLWLYKRLHNIHRPIIHYYAVCWNEERLLPFVLDYYSKYVDEILIYDNCSDDHSVEIINNYPSTKIVEFKTDGFNDFVHIDIKNNCWKKSRGKADYVIVCDIDELIYSNKTGNNLNRIKADGYTIIQPFGYNMYSTDFPTYSPGKLITEQVRRGIRHPMMDKCILFDPHAIVEINYKPGAHECYPVGRVKTYREPNFKLLHYKHIGLEQLLSRNRMYVKRLSRANLENDYGTPYLRGDEKIISEFWENEHQSTEII
jgi:hypothetical protein